ncbi:MAG: RCC1 repeat-containing protein, partial [Deltaproteobacteria bacterium HGW-Deltaproteobacteria-17]
GGLAYTAITVYATHACATTTSGVLYCWGANDDGQLGRAGAASNVPVQATLAPGAFAVEAGTVGTCAITTPGRLWCWGLNDFGQLGGGPTLGTGPFSTPLPVVSP